MPDYGTRAADRSQALIEKRLKKVYRDAYKELKQELTSFTKRFKAMDTLKKAQVKAGDITKEQYADWRKGQVFIRDRWKAKVDHASEIMLNANREATRIINGECLNVFAENANYEAWLIEKDKAKNLGYDDVDAFANASFDIYDADTVSMLLRNQPELLPRREVNGKKDKAWNRINIANAVAQGIIQGDDIDTIAARIAQKTASTNMNAMTRYARTAMTGAQNAGRIETMHRAQKMGIKVQKKWLATLDSRTRDSHAYLDGQVKDVDKPFISLLGKIMYPGDPGADKPGDIYNCRCTLTYVYPDFADLEGIGNDDPSMRIDNESKQSINYMSYQEWKDTKQAKLLNDMNTAKGALAKAQIAIYQAGIDESKLYHNIWKQDVTLSDYASKKGSIQAKRDYYNAELAKMKASTWATPDQIKKIEDQLKLLDEFEQNGKLIEMRDAAAQNVQDILNKANAGKPKKSNDPFAPDAYTIARKNNAFWAKTPKEADSKLRAKAGDVWRNATAREKDGIFEYTQSYHKYNEPLRGIEYGTNRFLGVGNTDLNAGRANNGDRLNAMTEIIGKSTYDFDVWLQRGCKYGGMDKFFQIDANLLRNGTQQDLEAELMGKTVTEFAFMSCGSNKGAGLNINSTDSILLNIYAPKGTKMMYVEPFSAFGSGSGKNWDGIAGQTTFGQEVETILQQGTKFRVIKVEKKGTNGKLYVDLEVIDQSNQQKY